MQNRLDSKVYAGFYVRFAAYITDCMIALAVSFLLRLPLWTAAAAGLDILNKGVLFRFTIQDIIQYLAFASYFVLLTYFGHATPGKKLFRLEVITEDGSWTFLNILYRETIGRFISGLLYIGYIAVAVSAKKQGFHDMFCDTLVVYKDMISTAPVVPVPVAPVPVPMTSVPVGPGPVVPVPAGPVPMESAHVGTAPSDPGFSAFQGNETKLNVNVQGMAAESSSEPVTGTEQGN